MMTVYVKRIDWLLSHFGRVLYGAFYWMKVIGRHV